MNRRHFLGASLALAAPATFADAQHISAPITDNTSTAPDLNAKPYVEVGNYPDDKNRVFLFFSYECPFCAQYVPSIVEWSRTFPKQLQLVHVPIITDDMSTKAGALAYYIVRDLAPDRLAELDATAFNAAGSGIHADTFPQILRQMKFSQADINTTIAKDITKNRMRRSVMLFDRYQVTATPHFGIGGRYATNVTFTGGNYQALMMLLNALISKTLEAA